MGSFQHWTFSAGLGSGLEAEPERHQLVAGWRFDWRFGLDFVVPDSVLAHLLQVAIVVEAPRIELGLVTVLGHVQQLELELELVPAPESGPAQQLAVGLDWDLAVVAAVVLEAALLWVQARSVLLYLKSEPET